MKKDEEKLINLLLTIDDVEFLYLLAFLEDVILKYYSKELIKEIRQKVFKRYNKLLNINNIDAKTRDFKDGD